MSIYDGQGLNCCNAATAIPFDSLSMKLIQPNTKAPKINNRDNSLSINLSCKLLS